MDDPRAAESVEHLQTAARELIRAARSLLDLVEDVVEDPDRLAGAASSVAGLVKDGLGQLDREGRAPWTAAAWGGEDVAAGARDHDADDDIAALDDLYVIDDDADAPEPPEMPEGPEDADPPGGVGQGRTPTRRVRRIAVE